MGMKIMKYVWWVIRRYSCRWIWLDRHRSTFIPTNIPIYQSVVWKPTFGDSKRPKLEPITFVAITARRPKTKKSKTPQKPTKTNQVEDEAAKKPTTTNQVEDEALKPTQTEHVEDDASKKPTQTDQGVDEASKKPTEKPAKTDQVIIEALKKRMEEDTSRPNVTEFMEWVKTNEPTAESVPVSLIRWSVHTGNGTMPWNARNWRLVRFAFVIIVVAYKRYSTIPVAVIKMHSQVREH